MFRSILSAGLLLMPAAVVSAEQSTEKKASVNFADHVLPIFRQHCLQCHNANDAEAGLAIDSYGALMEGGGSGDVVSAGDVSASRLYLVMTHAEEPAMPPNQDPIPKEQLEVIRQWIEGGLLENSGSKAKKRKGPSLTFASSDGGKPDQIIMPESVWRVPVVTSDRAAAATALAASPWAPLVAVAGQRQVSLYNTDTANLLGIIPYPEGIPQVLRFSRDGGYLLVAGGTHSSKGTASLYDIRNGERVLTVGDELDVVFGADIDDRLARVALGGPQKMVRIYDSASGETVFELKKHTDWVYCVDYSPDGVLVASGDRSGGLHVWEADTGRLYLDLIGHKGAIRGLAWRPDSNVLVSASEDGTVKLWEMNEGKQLKSFNAHGGGVTGVTVAKDGRIVTCGKDRTVKLWKADGSGEATMPAFGEPALEATITHDGSKLIGGDWNGRTLMWVIKDPKQVQELSANPPRLEEQKNHAAATIANLEKELAAATGELAKRQQAVEAARQNEATLTAKLQETKQLLAKANVDKAAAEKLFTDLKAEKAAEENKLSALNRELAQLAESAKKLESDLQQQRALVAKVTARRDAARQERDRVKKELQVVQTQQQKLKGEAIAVVSDLASRELDLLAQHRIATDVLTKSTSTLENQDNIVTRLRSEITDLEIAASVADATILKAQADLKAIVESEGKSRKQLASTKTGIEAKKGELTAQEKQLAEASEDAQKKAITEKVAALKAEIDSLHKQMADGEAALAEREKDAARQKAVIEDSSKKSAEAKKVADVKKRQYDEQIKALEGMMSAHQQHHKARDVINGQLATLREQIKAADARKSDAAAQMAPLLAKVALFTESEQKLAQSVAHEEAAKAEAEKKIKMLETDLASRKALRAEAELKRKSAETLLADLNNRVGAQPAEIAKLAGQIKTHTAAIPNVEKQLAEATKRSGEATAAMQQTKSLVDATNAKLASAIERLKGIESELVAFQEQSAKLAADLAAAKVEADKKRAAVEPESNVASSLAESMSARDQQLAKIAETMKMLQEEMAALQQSQSQEKAKLDEVKAKLSQLEAAAEEAESAAQAAEAKAEFFESAYGTDG